MPTYPGTGQSPWGVQLKQYIDDGDARARAAEVAAEAAAADAEAARDEAVPAAATASSAASVASGAAASAAASADTAAQAAEDAVAIVIADEDAAVAAMINTPGSDTASALSASFVSRPSVAIKAYDYGVRAGTGTDQSAALHAAFAAAQSSSKAAHVELPPGVITIDGGFALAGYSAGLRGAGGGNQAGVGRTGTVIKCINQTGAILDFTGFIWPADMVGRISFEGFTIQGDGTADPTKVKRGIYSPPYEYPVGYSLRDITISRTGGAPIEMYDTYFGLWENVTLCDPVGVVANDVPYAKITRGNGTVYINVGLRSQVYADVAVHPGDVGPSGAFILDGGDDLTHVYTRGVLLGCWAENIHLPSNTAIVSSKTMSVAHRDWSFFDCFKVKDATNTAFIHFPAMPTSAGPEFNARHGGNEVTGVIEGRTRYYDSNPKVWIDHGVRDSQGGNNIRGAKGWGGYNVLLDAGVNYTTVDLAGVERPTDVPGWIDNSGTTTNTLIDRAQGVYIYGGRGGQRRSYAQSGSPIGTLAAPPGAECTTDPTVAQGVSKWVKTQLTTNLGWEAVRGRTGRRTVTADLMNGWTDTGQALTIIRTGDTVTLAGQLVRGTADQFYSVPLGFRPNTTVRQLVRYGAAAAPQNTVSVVVAGSLAATEATFAGTAYMYLQWTTADPWPTSLPGLNSSGGTSWIAGQ